MVFDSFPPRLSCRGLLPVPHALCKLPFGQVNLKMKQGRLAKGALRQHQKQWATVVQAFVDEVSMVSADQFLQCDVRLRQAKLKPFAKFGNLAMNICGDFLQLPPVDKHGTRKCVALPVDDVGQMEVEDFQPAQVRVI